MFPFFTVKFACIQGVLWSLRCHCLLLAGLYDLVSVSVVTPFFRRSDVNRIFICYAVKFFHVGLRVAMFMHAHLVLLVLEEALLDRSVIFLCGTQVISCLFEVFVILQSFHNVDHCGYSLIQLCEFQGRT